MKLSEISVDDLHAGAPVRFLFSHAMELYLKAYLLLKEVTVEELRSMALGHNIEKLTSKGVELSLNVTEEDHLSMGLVNDVILDRYIETGPRMALLPERLSEICSNLHEQIGPLVYQNAGLTRRPKPYRQT